MVDWLGTLLYVWTLDFVMRPFVASDSSAFSFILLQMAFELYGMLAGNVSPTTGQNVKPAYGGAEEAFLKLVVTPIYKIIEMVKFVYFHYHGLVQARSTYVLRNF